MASAPNPANGTDVNVWTAIIAGGSFVLNFLIACGTAIWALGRSKIATDDKIADKDKAVTVDMIALERRMREENADSSRNFGETVQALRQKITETELWNRDNFVNKQTFNTVISEQRRAWEQFEKRLDERLNRFEDKLDGRDHRKNEFGG